MLELMSEPQRPLNSDGEKWPMEKTLERPNIGELLVFKNIATESLSFSTFSLLSLAQTLQEPPHWSSFLYPWRPQVHTLEQGFAKFFCKGPNSKYLQLFKPQVSISTAVLRCCSTEAVIEDR